MSVQILDVQHPEASCQDAYVVNTSPSTSYGSSIYFRFGRDSSASLARGLIKLDTSSLPSTAYITKATLKLYCVLGNSQSQYGVHEVTSSWNELVNWSNMPSFQSTPYLTLDTQFNAGQWYEIDLTNLVREWHLGTKINNGILIKSVSSTVVNQVSMASSSFSESWNRPIFHYEYTSIGKKKNSLINNNQGGALFC